MSQNWTLELFAFGDSVCGLRCLSLHVEAHTSAHISGDSVRDFLIRDEYARGLFPKKIKIKGIKILILKVVNCRIFLKSFIWGSLLCLSLVSPLMKSLLRVAERKSNLYQNWCKHEFFVPKFKFWKSFFPWFFCHQNIMCFEL